MIFERLRLVDDVIPGEGAWNMAVDEMLTRGIVEPTLRIYRWSEPTVTFGYFEPLAEVRRLRPGLPLMRRWTGGGLVDHGADLTYSLMIPAGHPLAGVDRGDSYCQIHRAIQAWLEAVEGIRSELATGGEWLGEGCFARPVQGDLLVDGRKIAGAAQRRTRRGLLHQGSVRWTLSKPFDPGKLAGAFAGQIARKPLSETEQREAARLVANRYGRPEWLEHR